MRKASKKGPLFTDRSQTRSLGPLLTTPVETGPCADTAAGASRSSATAAWRPIERNALTMTSLGEGRLDRQTMPRAQRDDRPACKSHATPCDPRHSAAAATVAPLRHRVRRPRDTPGPRGRPVRQLPLHRPQLALATVGRLVPRDRLGDDP